MILRRMLAIWISKATCVVCKLAGKQGVTLAGKIALKIDPKILMELSGQVRKKIFITCGTNGKTTTNNLLCSAIEAEGEKVICNHTGSNMLNGVVSAFVLAAKWNGKLDADYACIEIDEASTVRVLPYFKPDYMILTNLFRDQLDRYGEIDITMELLKKAMHKLEIALKDAGIKAEVSGRRKHIYSIYRKLNIKKVGLNEIYDLVALRIIVDTVQDCYGALGIVHSLWRPFPGRFKDYISMPKTNMYRSLHTTLFSDHGMPFEVQIRTWEMHRTAEYGIAAHWMYKEGRTRQDELDTKLAWLRQLVDYDSDANSTKEYVDNVRHDFFSDYVFVLTPNGEIIDLPLGSTPVDFAYRIHSNVGNHTQHAKVNGALVKLDCKLKTHDVVEIITNPQATPSRDWLNFVKTSQAKAKIKQWFKKANREENIVRGKEMLADAARRQGQKLADLTKAELCKPLLKRFSMNEMDDIYAAIGYGGITTGQALHKLMEARRKVQREEELARKLEEQEHAPAKSFDANGRAVIVKGEANMVVRFAQCCSPLPGDEIFGYITRGRGVSIHSRSCPNAAALLADADRIIDVSWADGESAKFPVTIHITASERVGLLMDISQMLMNMKININLVNAKPVEDGTMIEATMGFQVQNAEHLDSIIKNLMKINGVKSVSRVRSV